MSGAPSRILVVRHGNTFGPDDRVVWVGRRSDLPLVEKGLEQAHAVAAGLKAAGLVPTCAVSGNLKRTRVSADIVAAELGIADRRIDGRLDEVDYGVWEGKSSEEIQAIPGHAELMEAWQKHDRWPEGAGWGSTRADVVGALASLLADMAEGKGGALPLLVSSNGILRFAPEVLGATVPAGTTLQLKTGHMGVLDRSEGGWTVAGWNLDPARLAEL
ncbi:MAG: histidine phosphatase family protein [Actinomycetota bacterium]